MAEDRYLKSPSPPALARIALSACTQTEYREDILGDLQEEYVSLQSRSRRHADRWYWNQVVRSVPGLVLRRLQCIGAWRIGLLFISYILALLVINLWDVQVARKAAYFLAKQPDGPSLSIIRTLYFLVFTVGAGLAGALAAALGFKREKSFRSNALLTLGPVFLVLTCVMAANLMASGRQDLFSYLIIRSLLLATMLLLGAYLFLKARDVFNRSSNR